MNIYFSDSFGSANLIAVMDAPDLKGSDSSMTGLLEEKMKINQTGGTCAHYHRVFRSSQRANWAPSGPLMFQIGFGADGSMMVGRVIARVMEEQTGWNVVVENKPGAGGVAMFLASQV